MVRLLVIVLALPGAACGRVAFDPYSDGGANGDATIMPAVRRTLRLDRIIPTATLDNFPIPLFLDNTRIDRNVLAADASDLRFFDSSNNLIPHEVEQLAPTLIVWVRIPNITGVTTTFDMTYGGTALAPSTTPVWSSKFGGVFHLGETGDAKDSSSNANTATATSVPTVPGIVGNARSFTAASSSHLTIPGVAAQAFAPTEFTISAWVRSTAQGSYRAALARQFGSSGDNDLYLGTLGSMAIATCEIATGELDAVGGTATSIRGRISRASPTQPASPSTSMAPRSSRSRWVRHLW